MVNTSLTSGSANITAVTAGGAQITNLNSTTATVGTLLNTNLVNTSLTSGSAQISNANITSVTAGNVNLGSGNLFSNTFNASNNVTSASNVTNFSFDNASIGCFTATVYVKVVKSAGGNLYSMYTIEGLYSSSGWIIYPTVLGDNTGIVFSITENGQIQYTSSNQSNWTSTTIKYVVVQV